MRTLPMAVGARAVPHLAAGEFAKTTALAAEMASAWQELYFAPRLRRPLELANLRRWPGWRWPPSALMAKVIPHMLRIMVQEKPVPLILGRLPDRPASPGAWECNLCGTARRPLQR